MSMLAERKSKQKWSLNPRGKAWSEDSNKFGQKMLEKMGWSHGKGLGAKEDGIVDNIKLSYKNDSKGMGYKESNNQWTEHDSNFNALLQSLSGEKAPENDIKISSLEKKSQSSKVRVHYKKFTRGKDLSRCSEKDLANIFGKKSFKEIAAKPEVPAEEEKTINTFTHNAGSMVDYFKKKIPNFGKINGFTVGNNGVLKKDSESEEETYSGFGFKSPNVKKRKSNGEIPEGTPKKIKCDDPAGVSNPAFDPRFNKVEVQKHILNTIEEEDTILEDDNLKKKKKSDPNLEDNTQNQSFNMKKKKKKRNSDVSESSNNEEPLDPVKKKNKENDSIAAIDNLNFNDESCQNSYVNGNFEIKRKKKKNKNEDNHSGALDNPNFDEESAQNSYVNDTFEVARKKKKNKKESAAIDNPNFDEESCQDSYVNDNFEVKRKKNKNEDNHNGALDNPNFNEESCLDSYVNDTFEVKRKKKKNKIDSAAIDNPNFDEESCQDSYVNDNYEVKRKKKKNKNEENREDSYVNDNFEVKRKKKKSIQDVPLALNNPNFEEGDSQNSHTNDDYEVKRKKKKDDSFAIDNPNFDEDSCQNSYVNEDYEVKRKKKKLEINNESQSVSTEEDAVTDKKKNDEASSGDLNFDLILNITSTPSLPKPATPSSSKQSSTKRRKSVRFSNVNEERIIPNNEDLENRNELFDINSKVIANGLKEANGVSNLAFNRHQIHLEENIDDFSKKIDNFEAEIENDINEAKVSKYIGEVGNPDGENELLPEGTTKLKFKYARFGKTPVWARKRQFSHSKSSYKHLIKGDVILGFKNTNLHEINGYGVNVV